MSGLHVLFPEDSFNLIFLLLSSSCLTYSEKSSHFKMQSPSSLQQTPFNDIKNNVLTRLIRCLLFCQ